MNQESPQTPGASPPSNPVVAVPPRFHFSIWFMVWFLAALISAVVTFVLPERFAASARIRIERDQTDIAGMMQNQGQMAGSSYDPYFIQTEFEVIQSEVILGKVVDALQLTENGEQWQWPDKYASGQRLKRTEAMTLLKGRIDLRPVRNTSLIEIRVISDDPKEAEALANALAFTYKEHRLAFRQQTRLAAIQALQNARNDYQRQIEEQQSQVAKLSLEQTPAAGPKLEQAKAELEDLRRMSQMLFMKIAGEKVDLDLPARRMVEILDPAILSLRPVAPNKPVNILLGVIVGGVCGFIMATVVYALERSSFRRRAGIGRAQIPPRMRALFHITIALVVGVVIGYTCALPVDFSTIILVPLTLLIGSLASAWIELTVVSPQDPPHGEDRLPL